MEIADHELSTQVTNRGYIDRVLKPALGEMPLHKLQHRVDLIDRLYSHLRRCGTLCDGARRVDHRIDGEHDCAALQCTPHRCKGLQPATMRRIHAILSTALNYAIGWEWMDRNPAEYAHPPKVGWRRPQTLSPEQVAQLINLAWDEDPEFGLHARDGVPLPILDVLPDGSHLSRIADPGRPGDRGAERPWPPTTSRVSRCASYGVSAQEAGGDPTAPPGELYCLATTLLGHQAYPVEEFPDRYAERWEVEAAIGVVETRLRDGPEVVLRSKSPDLVREEGYALLCIYQAIRHLIATAAENARIDPDRISSTRAMQAVCRHVCHEAALSPLRAV